MSTGQGFLGIFNDVPAAAETDYLHWLTREHTQERLSVPGFLRVRVFRTEKEEKSGYFILYRLRHSDVVASEGYFGAPQCANRMVASHHAGTERLQTRRRPSCSRGGQWRRQHCPSARLCPAGHRGRHGRNGQDRNDGRNSVGALFRIGQSRHCHPYDRKGDAIGRRHVRRAPGGGGTDGRGSRRG